MTAPMESTAPDPVDPQDRRMYEMGFYEGIRTALSVLDSKGYNRGLKTLKRMLENSRSRRPGSTLDMGGNDKTRNEA